MLKNAFHLMTLILFPVLHDRDEVLETCLFATDKGYHSFGHLLVLASAVISESIHY